MQIHVRMYDLHGLVTPEGFRQWQTCLFVKADCDDYGPGRVVGSKPSSRRLQVPAGRSGDGGRLCQLLHPTGPSMLYNRSLERSMHNYCPSC